MDSEQECLCSVFLSELSQGEAGVAFEVLAEGRLVGVGEAVCQLLEGLVGGEQHMLDVDNSVIRAYFSMSERDLMEYLYRYKTMDATVKNMPEVRLMLSGGLLYEKSGKVESISGIVDETTGAVSACALFDNSDGILLSGGTGKYCP